MAAVSSSSGTTVISDAFSSVISNSWCVVLKPCTQNSDHKFRPAHATQAASDDDQTLRFGPGPGLACGTGHVALSSQVVFRACWLRAQVCRRAESQTEFYDAPQAAAS